MIQQKAPSSAQLTSARRGRAAAAERRAAAEGEEALLAADAALLREFAESDQVTVDGVVIPATCAAAHQPVNKVPLLLPPFLAQGAVRAAAPRP